MNFNQNTSSPVNFTPGKDNDYTSSNSDVGTRPAGDPKARKDFKKILAKSSDKGEEPADAPEMVQEGADEAVAMESAVTKKKGAPSLFDLTSGKDVSRKPLRLSIDDDEKVPSPSDAYRKLSTEKKPAKSFDDLSDMGGYANPDEKGKFTTRFETPQSDLSSVNPMAALASQQIQPPPITKQERVEPTVNLQAIIDQLVEKVTELKGKDTTETTVTLKQPPLFQGVNIVVTSFDSAKGQFNISFENLTQQAKNILDMQVNRESLLSALNQRGYGVHIVTTTTLVEHPPYIASAQPDREPNRERREPDQGQQRRQRNQ